MAPGRNDPCPCGSGKKYKNCHAKKSGSLTSNRPLLAIVALVIVGGGIWLVTALRSGPPGEAPPGKVWSAEHGHWHDATQSALPQTTRQPTPQPAGAVPEGKVWSAEHGHWHDEPGAIPSPTQTTPQPDGEVPEGQVWSPEHGHWHDADGGEGRGEDGVSASDSAQTSAP